MGAKKNGSEQKKMNGNEKKWSGPGINDPDREKMARTKKTSLEYGEANHFI
jgi:hypothetical protein